MTKTVELRALKGFSQAGHYVRRGGIFKRSKELADNLIKVGYAEEIPTPIQAMVRCAQKLGVGLVIAEGTHKIDEIRREASESHVGVIDQRPKANHDQTERRKPGRPRKNPEGNE